MDFADRVRNYIQKLRSMSERKKKAVLWTIVIFLGVIMGFFWVRGAIDNIRKMGENISQINLPTVDMSGMPNVDLEGLINNIAENASPGDGSVINQSAVPENQK